MISFYTTWLILFLMCFFIGVNAQHTNTWTAFWNADATLIGFKDQHSNIKIEPRFMGWTIAQRFDHITATTEEKDGNFYSCYLTKTGRKIGRDSLLIMDNSADCESEGFIRFHDKTTDSEGLFNRHGDIVVPAEYSVLSNVQNGHIIALKEAKKKYERGGEYYHWVGGRNMLIDTSNKVIINDFNPNSNISLYSLEVKTECGSDPIRECYKADDDSYYSFINFEKEFNVWLHTHLLQNIDKENLLACSNDEITYWIDSAGWINSPKQTFVKNNFDFIKTSLSALDNERTDFFISSNGLNKFIFDTEQYAAYFDNCGQAMEWIYPVKSIIITYQNNDESYQNHFDFLRTQNGYKLISISSGMNELK